MNVQYVETANRVFRLEERPNDPDAPPDAHCRRTVTVTLESGPPLTREEVDSILLTTIADAVSRGIDVIGWDTGDEDDDAAKGDGT